MAEDRNSYGSIMKAMSLFGGVKIYQILLSIIRSKVIAVLLGPVGMGISGLLLSTTDLISTFIGLGLNTSGVRDVSQSFAKNNGNNNTIDKIISIIRILIIFTGIVGAFICFIFSSQLSLWTFGNYEYSTSYKMLSIIILFNEINVGQTILLQGTFNYKLLAKSTIYGNTLSLVLTLPLYYFYRENGIVPSLIISSFITLLLSWFYSSKIKYNKIKISVRDAFIQGKPMIVLGVAVVASGLSTTLTTYLFRIVISHFGSIADVGLYTAGMGLTSTYVMTILSSMGTDYAPRLSAARDSVEMCEIIKKQASLLMTIVTPLVVVFFVLSKVAILVLYSTDFLAVLNMLYWIMLGMFFRAVSWSMSYSLVAHGDTKLFFVNELFINIISFVLYTIGYIYFSFTGIGIAFCLVYLIYTIQMYFSIRKMINFTLNKKDIYTFVKFSLISILSFVVLLYVKDGLLHYVLGFCFILLSVYISITELNKMIDVKNILSKYLKR